MSETDGARLTRKGQATKERITKIAADLIFDRGVAGTSIDDVRKAAEVSGSQMTHYFADKRSLVRAVAALQGGVLLTQTTRDIRPLEMALKNVLAHVRSFATDGAERVKTSRKPGTARRAARLVASL